MIIKKKSILFLGPIPPPFGGVSVHIKRLSNLLKDDFDFDFIDESRTKKREYSNLRKQNYLRYLIKVKNSDLLFIHSGKNILRVLHIVVGKIFGKKLILTIHNYRRKIHGLRRFFLSRIFGLADVIIVVNAETKKLLSLPENKFILKEAFIPPDIHEEQELPEYIYNWILKNKNIPIICANASNMETYDKVDLYGLDLSIEVTKRLIQKGIAIKFIFVVTSTHKNHNKFRKYQELIKTLNLEENFMLVNDSLSFIKIIQLSDIVLRPTNTDGDAVTIREGLFLNKIVLASDIVKRPEKVFLFKNRNIDHLEFQLKNLIKLRGTIQSYPSDESLNDLRIFYSQLIANTFR